MTANVPTLTLFSDELFSKWGFNDGDMPDDVCDHLDEIYPVWPILDWHKILVRLVKEHLLPILEQHVELVEICTNHNPIRASTVDGVDVSGLWHSVHYGDPLLTPEYVDIPMSVISGMIGEL